MPKVLLFFFLLISNLLLAQQTVGLFQNDSTAFNGYTLFAPAVSETTYLIDNCGNQVHSWESEYRPGLSVYLLENGNLLRTARIPTDFNAGGSGGRVELFNWEGDLLWGYNYSSDTYHHHHDIEPLPNGNILILAWEEIDPAEVIEAGRDPEQFNGDLWSEHIVEVRPIGTDSAAIVWEWHLWDHLIQDFDETKNNYGIVSDHPERINLNYALNGATDWVHANSVNYNAELDQIIINSRNFSEFWIIDHSTTKEEAASSSGGNVGKGGDILYRWGNPMTYNRGTIEDTKTFSEHDVQWIPDDYIDGGQIMIFNNGLGRPGGNYTSIDVIDPPLKNDGSYTIEDNTAYGPEELTWTYFAPFPSDFFAPRISGSQRLANGNTLICSGQLGHFFEVDYDGNIVWDYVNPVNSTITFQGEDPLQNDVFRTTRYATNYPAFENKELIPIGPIEINPLPSDCEIFEEEDISTNTMQMTVLENVSIQSNPIFDQLIIENTASKLLTIELYNLRGQILINDITNTAINRYNTQQLIKGFYFVKIINKENNQIFTQKIVKL